MKATALMVVNGADRDLAHSSSLDAFATEAKSVGADAVFFAGRGDGGGCRLLPRVLAKLGSTIPLLGGSGFDGPTCLKDAGANTTGLYSIRAGAGSLGDRANIAARGLLLATTAWG